MRPWLERIERDGFAVLPGMLSPARVDAIRCELGDALHRHAQTDAAIHGPAGTVYAARNVLEIWPRAGDAWRVPPLVEVLAAVLGPQLGLVRALFFDKPPEQTWALPWHKDQTVAVRDNRRPSRLFTKPTFKAGVPHAEAPADVLQRMLTVRLHLDPMTDENGPLKVLPGSHRTGQVMPSAEVPPVVVLGEAGDVLLMRPLLAHASGRSREGTRQSRRVLHLEFAADPALPDGYAWHTFLPARAG